MNTQKQNQPKAELVSDLEPSAILARYPARPAAAFTPLPADAPWRLVKVRPGFEFKVVESLKLYELPAYAPRERVWRPAVHGQPKRPHDRPLIRGYVFARLGDVAHLLHEIDGAVALLAFDGQVATVPEKMVAKLKRREADGEFDETRISERRRKGAPRKVGDQVMVHAEPFDGWIGTVVKLKGERRVQVLLDQVRAANRPVTLDLTALSDVEEQTDAANQAAA